MFDQEREELEIEYWSRYDDIRERFGSPSDYDDHGDDDDYAPEPGVELFGFNLVQVGAWLVEAGRLAAHEALRVPYESDDIPF